MAGPEGKLAQETMVGKPMKFSGQRTSPLLGPRARDKKDTLRGNRAALDGQPGADVPT
jgi:hypothetical protein